MSLITFFNDLDTLNSYSLELGSTRLGIHCAHCQQDAQWVSHGFVYKKSSGGTFSTVGKRVICSNRHNKFGCGRTIRLYLAHRTPNFQYPVAAFFAFVKALLASYPIDTAYQQSTGAHSSRNAYHWLNRFLLNTDRYRIQIPFKVIPIQQSSSSHRINVIKETFAGLIEHFDCGKNYQYKTQQALIVL